MSKPKVEIDFKFVRSLTDGDLAFFRSYAGTYRQQGLFLSWMDFIESVAITEQSRRNDPSIEGGMVSLPCWNFTQLGEALAGGYVMSRQPCTESSGAFVDHAMERIISLCSDILLAIGVKKNEQR
jgi:hypothetical protein